MTPSTSPPAQTPSLAKRWSLSTIALLPRLTSAIATIGRGFGRGLCRLNWTELACWTALQGVTIRVYRHALQHWGEVCLGRVTPLTYSYWLAGPILILGAAATARSTIISGMDVLTVSVAGLGSAFTGWYLLPELWGQFALDRDPSGLVDALLVAVLPLAAVVFALPLIRSLTRSGGNGLLLLRGSLRVLTAVLAVLAHRSPALVANGALRRADAVGLSRLPFPVLLELGPGRRTSPVFVNGSRFAAVRHDDRREAFGLVSSMELDDVDMAGALDHDQLREVRIAVPNRGSGTVRGFCGPRGRDLCLNGDITFDGVNGHVHGLVKLAADGEPIRFSWSSSSGHPSNVYINDEIAVRTLSRRSDIRLLGRTWNEAMIAGAFIKSQFADAAQGCERQLRDCLKCCRKRSFLVPNPLASSKNSHRHHTWKSTCEPCHIQECANLHDGQCRGLLPALPNTS